MSDVTGKKLAGCIGLISVGLITMVGGTILSGWALTILWRWFMVSIFHLPVLSIPQAIGAYSVISYITHQYVREPEDTRSSVEKMSQAFAYAICKPAVYLLMGWIVKQWM